jgi:dihydrofolate synthase/folylpolyglutamate synthase
MNYSEKLHRLFNVNFFGGSKLGLANMEKMSAYYGHPERQFRTVHIAGSNGKGSVALKMAKAFEKSGLKTGLYTSPHIATFRERIKINGEMIPEEAVVRLLEFYGNATFFELTTMLAFRYFEEQKVDIAVIETGLGGRLDATNILQPELSIITSISLEHTEILGRTLEEIAREKGGIIKPPIPAVIGPRVPAIFQADRVTGTFHTYDEENSAIAARALSYFGIENPDVSARPSCRMEIIGRVILDAAHNPDSMKELARALAVKFPGQKFHIVLGMSKSKDISGSICHLLPIANSFYLTEAENGRGENPLALREQIPFPSEKIRFGSLLQALHEEGPILVTGTFFIMKKARQELGLNEPSDPIDMNERISSLALNK